MARIAVSLGSLPVVELPLPPGSLRIGRDAANDLVLSLPEVAEFHAAITLDEEGASVRAAEGESISVNGRPVDEAALEPGDQVLLGGYRLRYLGDPGPGGEGDRVRTETGGFQPTGPLSLGEGGAGPQRVIVVDGADRGLEHPLDRPAVVVGRAPDCDVVLSDDTVSWRHLTLERMSDGVRARDLGSRNGTFLDRRKIESAVVPTGARVRIGRTTLELGPTTEARPEGRRARPGLGEMIGRSRAMRGVFERIREASAGRVSVLLEGETGTGKELAARALHALGSRSARPFVPVNCAAIPREMIEAELFGHTRGAFTGATTERAGAFESAAGGIIFLDEIAEMPLDLQPKLLRVLEEGAVPRLGGGSVACDFRVVAASNRDLRRAMAAGRFREDLYYRLAMFPIRLPPLRDRLEDLPDLVREFLAGAARSTGIPDASRTRFEEESIAVLRRHDWPGNVRELRNVILRAAMRRPGQEIDAGLMEELLAEGTAHAADAPAGPQSLQQLEREAIANALRDCDGRRRPAARRLGIAESTLYEKIRRYGLGG